MKSYTKGVFVYTRVPAGISILLQNIQILPIIMDRILK